MRLGTLFQACGRRSALARFPSSQITLPRSIKRFPVVSIFSKRHNHFSPLPTPPPSLAATRSRRYLLAAVLGAGLAWLNSQSTSDAKEVAESAAAGLVDASESLFVQAPAEEEAGVEATYWDWWK